MPLLPIGFIVLVLGCALVFLSARAKSTGTPLEEQAARHLTRIKIFAFVCGILTFILSASRGGDFGKGLMVAPALSGAVAMGVIVAGEMTLPRETGEHRTTSLTPRGARSVTSPRTWWVSGTALATLMALFVIALATATRDDMGRAGRSVGWNTRDGSQSSGPWPGTYYAIPALIALTLLCVLTYIALRAVSLRAQLHAYVESGILDERLRQGSARMVTCIFCLALSTTLAGVAFAMSTATNYRPSGTPSWVSIVHIFTWVGIEIAMVTFIFSLTQAVTPREGGIR